MGRPGAAVDDNPCPNRSVDGAGTQKKVITHTMTETYRCTERSIPAGLVGPRCAASVFLEGVQCESIMDTGSQVTTVSECFHKNHLSHLPIHPIHALLEIEGAGGQQVPYLGYIEARVTFPLSVPGRKEELVVLALVVPECQFNSRTPLLIGTNVLLRLYEQVLEQDGPEVVCKLFSRDFAVIFQHIAQIHDLNNHAHPVRLHGGNPITIPAKQKCCITGDVRLKRNSQTTFVLEPNEHHRLPGGVFLEAALMDIPFKSSCKVPVVLRNLSDHDVTLQPKCIIAQICAAQQVTSLGPVKGDSHHKKPDSDNLEFNLDDSPISEQWKDRIITKLRSIPEVFAVDDLSYGHTTAVKHHIRLHDETPFKERPRPIHPSDREAVKEHLNPCVVFIFLLLSQCSWVWWTR